MSFDDSEPSSVCSLCWTASGALALYASWNSPYASLQYQSNPGIIAPNGWYGIEWEITFSLTGAGTLKVWVNGNQVVNATGLNTNISFANRVYLGTPGGSANNPTAYYDDYRVWDNTGSTQNAPVGYDTKLITSLPAAGGAFTEWTPNGATANWECVDDNPPNGGATYVSGTTSGLMDAYVMQNPQLTANPVMVVARSYVTQNLSHSLKIGVDSSGTQSFGPSVTPTNVYGFIDACIPDDPATVAPWTYAGANAAQHCKQQTA
jgi:hypothetical protein